LAETSGFTPPWGGARPLGLVQASVQACKEVGSTVVPLNAPPICERVYHLRKAEDFTGMGFHQCIECQNLFMADEKKCPNCGKPVVPPLGRDRLGLAALLSLVVVLGVVGYQLAAYQRSDLKPPSAFRERGHSSVLPPPEAFEPAVHPLEEHYSRLLAYVDQGQFERAAEALSIMKDLKGLNYRDTPLLAKRLVIHGLEEDAKRIPADRIADNIAAYRKLLVLDPGNRVYQQKIALYEARRRELRTQVQDRDRGSTGKLDDQQTAALSSAERLVGIPF
jgi:hypothetical protein